MKHLLSIKDLTGQEIFELLQLTEDVKKDKTKYYGALKNKSIGLLFQKSSTRTRLSFQVAMTQMGGSSYFIKEDELQLKRGESIKDTARTMARYLDGAVLRTFSHSYITDFAQYSDIPVINGLSDLYHPCQILGDIFTVAEKKNMKIRDSLDFTKHKIVYIGDGNNIANTFIELAAKIKINFTIICPRKYSPDREVINDNIPQAKEIGSKISITEDVGEVRGADFIYTDVWVSMGKEAERPERENIFGNFQVNEGLIIKAGADALVMHCLPALRGKEITDEVMDGPRSIVYDQAENRLHSEKAILLSLIKK